MVFIEIMAVILYFTFIIWTWHSLGDLEVYKKVLYLFIGTLVICLATLLIFLIANNGMNFGNVKIDNQVRNVIVGVFAGVNCIILLPRVAKWIDKARNDELDKENFTKKLVILLFVFAICLVFEKGYMRSTQEGIYKVYYSQTK